MQCVLVNSDPLFPLFQFFPDLQCPPNFMLFSPPLSSFIDTRRYMGITEPSTGAWVLRDRILEMNGLYPITTVYVDVTKMTK